MSSITLQGCFAVIIPYGAPVEAVAGVAAFLPSATSSSSSVLNVGSTSGAVGATNGREDLGGRASQAQTEIALANAEQENIRLRAELSSSQSTVRSFETALREYLAMQPPSDLFEVSWLLLQKLIVGICRKKDLHFNPPPHIPIPTPTDREVPLLFGGIRAAITDLTDEGNHRPIYRTIIGSSSVQLLSILRRLTVDLVYDEDVVSAFSAIFTFDNLTSNKPLPVYILHAASVDIPGMAIINRPALDTVFDEWIDDGMWNLKADSPLDYAFTVLRVAGRWILVVLQPREKTATIYDPENEWTVESFEDIFGAGVLRCGGGTTNAEVGWKVVSKKLCAPLSVEDSGPFLIHLLRILVLDPKFVLTPNTIGVQAGAGNEDTPQLSAVLVRGLRVWQAQTLLESARCSKSVFKAIIGEDRE